MILSCWNCNNNFDYTPPETLAGKPKEYFQGSTVCKACVPIMHGNYFPVYDRVD